MLNISDHQVTHKGLNDDGSKAENLSTESWYIIAYVLDLGQSQLDNVLAEYPLLGHLADTLIRHDIDRKVPHYQVVEKENQPERKTAKWQ